MSILTIILNILAPPISIFRKRGFGNDLGINIIFTMLFFIPGIIHAFYLTSKQNQIL
ncbi:YqaE/Pmp3 family membrane protein [Nonlabens sp.]|uniref:YqaE/Pmp3 family membrane protein n=1 Tax=Nonlabens sp. TaxID=1888209 RepID=UPI0039E357D0